MYLRDLAIGISSDADLPAGHTAREVAISAHAVQEIFLSFMPRKYILDGMAKTNIELGPSTGKPQYQQLIDVNMYFVEAFDLRAYFAGSVEKRDDMLLRVLERSLLDIASRFGADPEPVRNAIAATRACSCERRYEISKMSRLSKSRKLKLNVYRHIFHGGESWEVDICNRKGEVLQTRSIAKNTDFVRSSYEFKRSVLKGKNFVILDWIGRQSYKLDVAKLEEKLMGAKGAS